MKKKFNIHLVPGKELHDYYGMNFFAAKDLHFHHPLLKDPRDILVDKRLGPEMRARTILHEEVEDLAMRPKMKYKKADSYALSEEHFAKRRMR
jgi:hypothetical protein